MIHKIKHHSKRIAANIISRIKGFTLIELLIVVAILGILAAAVLVAINPGKRTAQARDAQRKQDIGAIANALIGYLTLESRYPVEAFCDASTGRSGLTCPIDPAQSAWDSGASSYIYQNLVVAQALLKKLPVDPVNDITYYYKYEPGVVGNATGGTCNATADCWYWIGTLLEAPEDPTKPVFRCTDNPLIAAGAGCKEVSAGASFNTVTN